MANIGMEKVYQEFDPVTRWTSEPDAEILVVDLPGSLSSSSQSCLFMFHFTTLNRKKRDK